MKIFFLSVILLLISRGLPAQDPCRETNQNTDPENDVLFLPGLIQYGMGGISVYSEDVSDQGNSRRASFVNRTVINTEYHFYSANDSVPYEKTEERFNDEGKMTMQKVWLWDSISGNWSPQSRGVLSYDLAGRPVFSFRFRWNAELEEWVKYSKDSVVYDGQDGKIYYYFTWDKTFGKWEMEHRTEIYHGYYGLFYWIEDLHDWIGCCKNEYTFDDQGNVDVEYQYEWDTLVHDWVVWGMGESFYTEEGKLDLHIRFLKDETDGEWVNWLKSDYTYTGEDHFSYEEYEWDSDLGVWVLASITKIWLNERGDVTEHETRYPDHTTGGDDFRRVFKYLDNGDYSVISSFQWSESGNNWEIHYRIYYEYPEPVITGLENEPETVYSVFPNPAGQVLFFSGTEETGIIRFFTPHGKIVREERYINNSLDITGLPQGLYIILSETENGNVYKQKLVVR